MSHRWSGWPGAYCQDCGVGDVIESAICCRDCVMPSGPGDPPDTTLCVLHEAEAQYVTSGCPPTKAAAAAYKLVLDEHKE